MNKGNNKLNITIVGAGNSGTAHAFVLSRMGHKVTLLKTSRSMHDENYDAIARQGGVYGIDETICTPEREFVPIHAITRNPEEAFADADVVLVLTQSLQHKRVAELILPHIQHVKAVVVVPGNLGSIYFRRGLPDNVLVAEGESTIIDARIADPGTVQILFRNVRNALSFIPASDTSRGFAYLSAAIPNYTHTRSNVVETALHNPNLIVHTVGTIMSASRIEHSKGEFWLYREGFTPSIWNVINALDAEKMAVMQAYGATPATYLDSCKFRNEADLEKDSMEVFRHYAEHGSPKGPGTIHNRYLTEDVPNGLCVLGKLGHIAGVPTPMADALTSLASVMLGTDLAKDSRDFDEVGWRTKEDILKEI